MSIIGFIILFVNGSCNCCRGGAAPAPAPLSPVHLLSLTHCLPFSLAAAASCFTTVVKPGWPPFPTGVYRPPVIPLPRNFSRSSFTFCLTTTFSPLVGFTLAGNGFPLRSGKFLPVHLGSSTSTWHPAAPIGKMIRWTWFYLRWHSLQYCGAFRTLFPT